MELLDKQSLPKNSEPISFVCKTFDYDWFKFMEGNRKPDHVLSLMASFQRRDVPNAILCTNDGYIVDGQNRFLARKELGLPIYYYCIDGLDIHDVAYLNSYGKNSGRTPHTLRCTHPWGMRNTRESNTSVRCSRI